MHRRRLLQLMAAAPFALGAGRLYAAPAARDNRLLVVFMRGAYDAASLLVPAASDFYYESRPTIAIPRPGSGADAALPLADGWALHPALAASLMPFYRRRELAFLPFAGTEDTSRSHFETQNRIELGQGLDKGGAGYGSGFLNRLAGVLGDERGQAAAFTEDVPQICRGAAHVPNVDLGGASGALATRLGQLGRALAAYADAMGDAWKRTTVVVISEFGRTFRENGNKGTDHGHGTVYWVMGGAVRGGRIAGRQVEVRRDTLFQDRDYPVLNEYRAVFAGLFARLYGLDAARLAQVFPGVRPLDLKLV